MLSFVFFPFLSISTFYHALNPCCPAISYSTLSLHSLPWLHDLLDLSTLFCHPVFSSKACTLSGHRELNIDIERHRHIYRHRQTFGCLVDYCFSLEGHGLHEHMVSTRFFPCDMVKTKKFAIFSFESIYFDLSRGQA